MREIKDIKIMLLGITVILAVIVLHLFLSNGLITDLIAIIGVVLVFIGYKKVGDEKPKE